MAAAEEVVLFGRSIDGVLLSPYPKVLRRVTPTTLFFTVFFGMADLPGLMLDEIWIRERKMLTFINTNKIPTHLQVC